MAQINVDAIIRAVDQFTGPMRRIVAGIKPVTAGVGGVAKAARGVGSELSSLLGPFALITGGGAIAGLTRVVGHFTEMGGHIDDLSKQLGVMPEKLQAWTYAAKLNGVEQDQFADSVSKMNKVVAESAAGVDKSGAELFRRLGIRLKDGQGKLRTATDLMPEIANAIQKIENPALRTRVAMKLFSETGTKLLPMLQDGAAGLANFEDNARRLGIIMDGSAISAADALGDSIDTLKMVFEGLGNSIAVRIAPVIQPLVERLYEWAAANREIISQRVEAAVQKIADALARVDWAKFWAGLEATMSAIGKFVDFVGGWENALIGVMILMNGGLIASILSLGGSLLNLGQAVLPIAIQAATFFATTALPALGSALGFIIKAIFGMNAALAINPFVLMIGAILAVAVAITALVNNWGGARDAMFEVWDAIVGKFQSAKASIQPIIDWLSGAMKGLADILSGPVQAIGRFLGGVFEPIRVARAEAMGTAATGEPPAGGINAPQRSPLISKMQQGAAAQRSQADVRVRFDNLPPGTTVEADKSGSGMDLGVETGWQSSAALR